MDMRRLLLLTPALALAALGCSSSGEDPGRAEQRPTTSVEVTTTVAAPPSSAPRAVIATPPPAEPPPQVEASGECKTDLDAVRAVMGEYPSGLVAQQVPSAAQALNAAVESASSSCEGDTFQDFLGTEYKPWLTYEVPEDYTLPVG